MKALSPTAPHPEKIDPRNGHLTDRRRRRILRNEGAVTDVGRPLPRLVSDARTTPHFAMWMADLKIKSALQRMKIAKLAKTGTDSKLSGSYTLVSGRYKSLWDLIHATRSDLLALPGVGPARLKALHADLIAHNVQPNWSAE
jgi:hypothetical protein